MFPFILPQMGSSFVQQAQEILSLPEYKHFVDYLLGVLQLDEFSICEIVKASIRQPSSQSMTAFMNSDAVDTKALNDQRIVALLQYSQTRATDAGYVSIDDSLLEKKGSHIEGLVRVRKKKKKVQTGHQLVVTHYSDQKKDYPLYQTPYQQKKTLRQQNKAHLFKTKVQLALLQLEALVSVAFPLKLLLFDSWYCSKEMVTWIQQHDLWFISRLKNNRQIKYLDEWRPVQNLFEIIPSSEFQRCTILSWHRNGKKPRKKVYWVHRVEVEVRGLGIMTLVLSKYHQTERRGVVFITNNPDYTTEEILQLYSHRWKIEVFFREMKQYYHFNDGLYQNLTAHMRHYAIVFWSYSLVVYLSCLGLFHRKKSPIHRTPLNLKHRFQDIMRETFILSLINRVTDSIPVDTVKRLLSDPTTWKLFVP